MHHWEGRDLSLCSCMFSLAWYVHVHCCQQHHTCIQSHCHFCTCWNNVLCWHSRTSIAWKLDTIITSFHLNFASTHMTLSCQNISRTWRAVTLICWSNGLLSREQVHIREPQHATICVWQKLYCHASKSIQGNPITLQFVPDKKTLCILSADKFTLLNKRSELATKCNKFFAANQKQDHSTHPLLISLNLASNATKGTVWWSLQVWNLCYGLNLYL